MFRPFDLVNPFKPRALFYGSSADSAEPDQTPHIAASDQVQHMYIVKIWMLPINL